MELWIRSQDKNRLKVVENFSLRDFEKQKVNSDDPFDYEYTHTEIRGGGNRETTETLGVYSTHIRALQVLDEIQKHIYTNELKRFMGKEDEIFVTPIYTMPTE